MTSSGCNNHKFFTETFEFCSDFYLKQYDESPYEFTNVVKCADMELRAGLSRHMIHKKRTCSDLEVECHFVNSNFCVKSLNIAFFKIVW